MQSALWSLPLLGSKGANNSNTQLLSCAQEVDLLPRNYLTELP
jgi:hypothetical protein